MSGTTKPKSLVAKLAEVMELVDKPIAKGGFNKAQQYAFVNESDVSAAVRPLLAARGVWLWSSELTHEMTELFKTSSGNTMFLSRVTMQYQFIDGETGEVTPVQTYSGQGADTGDKSLPKAQSMALKYFLLKTFMLSTGKDDAEADEKVDKAAAASGAARGDRVRRSTQPGVERGGKSNVATEAQVNEVARIVRDLQMDPINTLLPLIIKVTGKPEPEGETKLRDWLGTFTSTEIAAVIAKLQEQEMTASVEESVEDLGMSDYSTGGEVEQEGFGIV